MPTASLEQVEVRALVPRTVEQQSTERLRRALGTPLTDAVPAAFDALDDLDPGAYWVLREVHAQVRVPASEADPARSAGAIARAMAGAVAELVLRGPSADAVRFADRAAYLAAYLHARVGGSGAGWVFARMSTLSALPPLDAVPAAARLLDVEILDAVSAVARSGDWERLLATAEPAGVERVWGVLARAGGSAAAIDLETWQALAELREAEGAGVRGRPTAYRRLRLLGLRARQVALTAADVAAVARWEGEEEDGEPAVSGRGTPSEVTSESAAAGAAAGEPGATAPPGASEHAPGEPSVLRCAGAVAFLLVADLAEVLESEEAAAWLLEPEPVAGEVRAAALAAVIGRGLDRDDVAVRLAAGLETAPDELESAPVIPGFSEPLLAQAHADDDAWFAPMAAHISGIGPLARAVARRFAAHLHGFEGAGLPYLADRVMPLGGSIQLTEDAVLVDLPRPPLHVLLAMAGLDAFTYRVPWLELPVLLTHEEEW